jgi:hypothetical protein
MWLNLCNLEMGMQSVTASRRIWNLALQQLKTLLHCCCRCKWFLSQLTKKQLGACLLLALRGHSAAQEALCLMLEWELIEQEDQKMQLVSTLQSTPSGRENYAALCQRQLHLRELVRKLTTGVLVEIQKFSNCWNKILMLKYPSHKFFYGALFFKWQ